MDAEAIFATIGVALTTVLAAIGGSFVYNNHKLARELIWKAWQQRQAVDSSVDAIAREFGKGE